MNAKRLKQIIVIKMLDRSAGQKPSRGRSRGKVRNIGSVGSTYQKVYQERFAIFCWGWFSIWSQISAETVTSGRAAIRPPSLSLRFATSETRTTTAAVSKYFVMIQTTTFLLPG
jgi:hypothetical protein